MSETLFRTIQNQSDIDRRTGVLESAEYAIMQVGIAAPAHTAAESVLYFDTVLDDLYINADGVNDWQLIAGGGGIVAAHNLLSVSHSDTLAGAPVRGNLIVADATPEWAGLVVGGAHQIFKVNAGATDPIWASFDWDEIASAAAADMVHNHTNNTEGGLLTTGSISDLAYAVPNLTLGVANAAGAANTVIQSDATILVFDAVVPNTIQPDDAAAVGVATVAARRDHEHGIVTAAPIANLSVSSVNAEGVGTSFSRNDHSHAITSSSDPGAAASLLATDVNGDITVQTLVVDVEEGIGTDTIPHGGVGYAMLALEGTDSSANGPHMQFTTATDNYPLVQLLHWTHDNFAWGLDAYWDGTWRSSDAGSNFLIYKLNDILLFRHDSGIAQGAAITWNESLGIVGTTGNWRVGGSAIAFDAYRLVNNGVFVLNGGSGAGVGANIELYGGAHATLANDAVYDADQHTFRSQNAATPYMTLDSTELVFFPTTRWDFPTEDAEFVDAGSAGATEQDWIEVTVGGNTGYIHVFAAV